MDNSNSSNNFDDANSQTNVTQAYMPVANYNNVNNPIYDHNVTFSPDQRPDVFSPNHQHQYDANYQQQPNISNYVTISSDQRDVFSPNHQHQYDANYQQQPDISN
jgi:hypothetical protein